MKNEKINEKITNYINVSLTAYYTGKFSEVEAISECSGYIAACHDFGYIDDEEVSELFALIAKAMCIIVEMKKS